MFTGFKNREHNEEHKISPFFLKRKSDKMGFEGKSNGGNFYIYCLFLNCYENHIIR